MKSTLLVLLLAFAATPARAAEAPLDPKRAEAGEHFARGLHLFENQDNDGALDAFRRAYALLPNPVVLFNIGLVSAAQGDAVAAVDALGQVLERPGSLKPDQLARARQVKDEQERRIGRLLVTTTVPAELDLDGVVLGRTPLARALRVVEGAHVVTALAEGHQPERRATTVVAGAQTDLAIALRPTESRLAPLTVSASVPGAEVLVDGQLVGHTPLAAPLRVEPGKRVIELRRLGYQPQHRVVNVAEGEPARASFELSPAPTLVAAQYGRVSLLSRTAHELSWTVDGHALGPYRGAILLPPGPHRIRLERTGHEPLERTIVVTAGAESPIHAELRPTADARQSYRTRAGTFRVVAVSALAAGLVLTAGAGGYSYWSNGKLDDARATWATVQADRAWGGPCDPTASWYHTNNCDQRLADARSDVSHYRGLRNLGLVATSIGAAAAVTGIVLYLTGDDPKRYDRGAELLARAPAWQPIVTVGPAAGALGVAGRF